MMECKWYRSRQLDMSFILRITRVVPFTFSKLYSVGHNPFTSFCKMGIFFNTYQSWKKCPKWIWTTDTYFSDHSIDIKSLHFVLKSGQYTLLDVEWWYCLTTCRTNVKNRSIVEWKSKIRIIFKILFKSWVKSRAIKTTSINFDPNPHIFCRLLLSWIHQSLVFLAIVSPLKHFMEINIQRGDRYGSKNSRNLTRMTPSHDLIRISTRNCNESSDFSSRLSKVEFKVKLYM